MRTRAVTLIVFAMTVGLQGAASAGVEDSASTNVLVSACSVEHPCVLVTGEKGGPQAVGSGLPDWMLECRWQRMGAWEYLVFVETNAVFPVADIVGGPDDYPTSEAAAAAMFEAIGATADDTIIAVTCPHAAMASAGIFRGGPVYERWIEGDPPPQAVLELIVARAQAAAQLPTEGLRLAPAGTPHEPIVVQHDTWLWIDPVIWQPVTATPAPIFGITATVTATPYRITFETGDGTTIDCGNNTGTPWHPDATDTGCSLTWHHTTATGDQTLTATTHWNATWACTAYCGTGTLPDYITQAVTDVTVAELQTLGTR